MTVKKEVWSIDAAAMFANHKNFLLWQKNGVNLQQYGGLAWGRPEKREIVQVLFLTAEDMTNTTAELLTSIMSADLQLVANLAIDGFEIPPVSLNHSIFHLSASQEILDQGDVPAFLDRNEQLKATQFTNQGVSLYTRAGIEFNLRAGAKEGEDLEAAANRYFDELDRIVFINQHKTIILSRKPENEAVTKVLDEQAKGAMQDKDAMEFTAYQSLSRNTKNNSDSPRLVPMARITRDGTKYVVYSAVLVLTVPVFCGDNSNQIYERLQNALRRQIRAVVLTNLARIQEKQGLVTTTSAVFCPPGWSSTLHLQLPDVPAAEQKSYRLRLQKLLNLSCTSPCLRPSQQIRFGAAASRLLRSPHASINNYKPLGKVFTVRGPYNYHHYAQDNFDDNGWGCAYRSLQTIWSWLILNGYTEKPVPTHREIQECLVKIGDKEETFIDSRQWIGSTEIGFVLDELLGIESKFITTGSGADMAEKSRELAHHFDTVGSPVMIGGGQLAHTILGVDFDENTGDCRFLVLDPHYTGSEDIRTVTTRGWCQWKPASFWKTEHFYNMVCPQPPANSI